MSNGRGLWDQVARLNPSDQADFRIWYNRQAERIFAGLGIEKGELNGLSDEANLPAR
jgi:hypothetical protein